MKTGFYPKLAFDGIRKNSRLYVPYILTCIGMVLMYALIRTLAVSPDVKAMKGGSNLQTMLGFGSFVMLIFAVIFLTYTNSFLIKRRTREFGVYNILGMNKRNLLRVLAWETLIVAGISLTAGILTSMVFLRLMGLIIAKILSSDLQNGVGIHAGALQDTAFWFLLIFLFLYGKSALKVRISKPVEMLQGEHAGEKAPKANWLLGLLGLIALGCGYYISLSIKNPLSAFIWFFAAVILVIIGTYFFMIAGSVVFCRLLQRASNYYYKPNHFVSVASMVYRMKRNGAGLASICILSTMVLVITTSTTSLYCGSEDSLKRCYPRDMVVTFQAEDDKVLEQNGIQSIREVIGTILKQNEAQPEKIVDYTYINTYGYEQNGTFCLDPKTLTEFSTETYNNLYYLCMVSLDTYNRLTGENEQLQDDEALMFTIRREYSLDTIAFEGGASYRIKKQVPEFVESGDAMKQIIPTLYLVVPNLAAAEEGLRDITNQFGDPVLKYEWQYAFNLDLTEEEQIAVVKQINKSIRDEELKGQENIPQGAYTVDSLAENREEYYAMYGGLFFLGVLLSIVFVIAAVLIIYYKQISEGYEDQARFEIMQKVGMTKKEIRKSINTQLKLVFFLPIFGAGLHLAFAFPIINKLLLLFGLDNRTLFILVCVFSFLVYGLFYLGVYRLTSNAYYKIVSGTSKS